MSEFGSFGSCGLLSGVACCDDEADDDDAADDELCGVVFEGVADAGFAAAVWFGVSAVAIGASTREIKDGSRFPVPGCRLVTG